MPLTPLLQEAPLVSLHARAPTWEQLGGARLAEAAVNAGAYRVLIFLQRCCSRGYPWRGNPYAQAVTSAQLLRSFERAGELGPLVELVICTAACRPAGLLPCPWDACPRCTCDQPPGCLARHARSGPCMLSLSRR